MRRFGSLVLVLCLLGCGDSPKGTKSNAKPGDIGNAFGFVPKPQESGTRKKTDREQPKDQFPFPTPKKAKSKPKPPFHPPVPRKTALEEFFGSVPPSRQAALAAFAGLKKRAGWNLYPAKDGTIEEARLGLGGINENMVKTLKWFPEMQRLSISYKVVTNEWVSHLKPLKNLKSLNLNFTSITDAAFPLIESFQQLEEFRASGTDTTDKAIESLAKLPKLRAIVMMKTGISDKGLEILRKINTLKVISIRGSKVTEKAAAEFRKARPDCKLLRVR